MAKRNQEVFRHIIVRIGGSKKGNIFLAQKREESNDRKKNSNSFIVNKGFSLSQYTGIRWPVCTPFVH